MSEMVEQVARAMSRHRWDEFDEEHRQAARELVREAIKAMRDLPENPGPRYSAGEYSRRNIEAMIDDCLND